MPSAIRIRRRVDENRHERGIVDTSVVISLEQLDAEVLPTEIAISAITLAELAAGPHATDDPLQRAERQDRLQRVEAAFEAIQVDADVARAYGRVYAAVRAAGRQPRGRAFDLLIAATALSRSLPLYTRNLADVDGLAGLVEVVEV
jgi:hypothetical protein